jgi:hypothetical protein
MSIKHVWVAGVVSLGLLQSQPCGAEAPTEMQQRAEILAAAERGFRDGDFEKLESVSSSYRDEKSRTASGLWKLTVFYAGVENAIEGIVMEQGGDEAYEPLLERIAKWTRTYPESPTAHIAYAMALSERAWDHRGTGYASSVSEEQWVLFRQYIAAAREHLEKHKAIAASDPRYYQEMIEIARDQQWDRTRFDALLEEAIGREPVFYQTYFSAFIYLLPQWHGNLEDIEDFAQYAVRKTQHLEGQGMYARIYWYASQTQFKNDVFNNSLADWSQMKAGFEDIISRYPDAWNLNNYARFACMARDKPKTAELLERIGTSVVKEAWQIPALKDQCAQWSAVS